MSLQALSPEIIRTPYADFRGRIYVDRDLAVRNQWFITSFRPANFPHSQPNGEIRVPKLKRALPSEQRDFATGLSYSFHTRLVNLNPSTQAVTALTQNPDSRTQMLLQGILGRWGLVQERSNGKGKIGWKVYLDPDKFEGLTEPLRSKILDEILQSESRFAPFMFGLVIGRLRMGARARGRINIKHPDHLERVNDAYKELLAEGREKAGFFRSRSKNTGELTISKPERILARLLACDSVLALSFLPLLLKIDSTEVISRITLFDQVQFEPAKNGVVKTDPGQQPKSWDELIKLAAESGILEDQFDNILTPNRI